MINLTAVFNWFRRAAHTRQPDMVRQAPKYRRGTDNTPGAWRPPSGSQRWFQRAVRFGRV